MEDQANLQGVIFMAVLVVAVVTIYIRASK